MYARVNSRTIAANRLAICGQTMRMDCMVESGAPISAPCICDMNTGPTERELGSSRIAAISL